ncbi:hypothetical protein [uncultured Mediterranean phage uvMED]|nr:hypothetical protein [uncultured Mediterranean phage uvMED]
MGGPSNSGSNDRDVSGAEAVASGGKLKTFSSRKINKNKRPADYNPEKDDSGAKLDLFINDPYTKKQGGPIMLRPLEPLFDKTAKANREFFTNKVLESKRAKKNIGYTKEEFSRLTRSKQEEVFKGYMSNRMDNKTDAYGNRLGNLGQDDRANRSPNLEVDKMPVPGEGDEADLTQPVEPSYGVEEENMTDAEIALKNKRKGRKKTILTSVTGDTSKVTLGKKTLLGG